MTGIEYEKRRGRSFGGTSKFAMQGEYEARERRRSQATGYPMQFRCDVCGHARTSNHHKARAKRCSKIRAQQLKGET